MEAEPIAQKPHQDEITPTSLPTGSKGHRYTKATAHKAVKEKLKRRQESAEFVASLQHQPQDVRTIKIQEFIAKHPNQRREVIREVLEQNLFMRLSHQHSLIASGDPLKKAEARKDDLGIGLEYDKLYKEQESDALTVKIPSALIGRLSGVLALKVEPLKTKENPDSVEINGGHNHTVNLEEAKESST